ncbi:hypothetical protein BGW38_010241 [Lunasporangiospora selenospora]|uniref:Uncharacterized protein n=1 Tax=Lunasporangiospora selenospora TaxID=979761 RepID=A0A9P6G2R0_9FUNG|nr:hypothetical protein BGW38_010241 [Lunasporangiospora selenospora]
MLRKEVHPETSNLILEVEKIHDMDLLKRLLIEKEQERQDLASNLDLAARLGLGLQQQLHQVEMESNEKMQHLQEQNQALQKKVNLAQDLSTQLRGSEHEVYNLTGHNQFLQKELDTCHVELKAFRKELDELTEQMTEMGVEMIAAKNKVNSYARRLGEVEQELARTRELNVNLQIQLENALQKQKQTHTNTAQAVKLIRSDLGKVVEESGTMRMSLEELESRQVKCEDKVVEMMTNTREYAQLLEEAQDTIHSLRLESDLEGRGWSVRTPVAAIWDDKTGENPENDPQFNNMRPTSSSSRHSRMRPSITSRGSITEVDSELERDDNPEGGGGDDNTYTPRRRLSILERGECAADTEQEEDLPHRRSRLDQHERNPEIVQVGWADAYGGYEVNSLALELTMGSLGNELARSSSVMVMGFPSGHILDDDSQRNSLGSEIEASDSQPNDEIGANPHSITTTTTTSPTDPEADDVDDIIEIGRGGSIVNNVRLSAHMTPLRQRISLSAELHQQLEDHNIFQNVLSGTPTGSRPTWSPGLAGVLSPIDSNGHHGSAMRGKTLSLVGFSPKALAVTSTSTSTAASTVTGKVTGITKTVDGSTQTSPLVSSIAYMINEATAQKPTKGSSSTDSSEIEPVLSGQASGNSSASTSGNNNSSNSRNTAADTSFSSTTSSGSGAAGRPPQRTNGTGTTGGSTGLGGGVVGGLTLELQNALGLKYLLSASSSADLTNVVTKTQTTSKSSNAKTTSISSTTGSTTHSSGIPIKEKKTTGFPPMSASMPSSAPVSGATNRSLTRSVSPGKASGSSTTASPHSRAASATSSSSRTTTSVPIPVRSSSGRSKSSSVSIASSWSLTSSAFMGGGGGHGKTLSSSISSSSSSSSSASSSVSSRRASLPPVPGPLSALAGMNHNNSNNSSGHPNNNSNNSNSGSTRGRPVWN